MKEEWLFPNAIVPVDVETTAALVAEIHRLIGVVGGMALAQPEQEPVADRAFLERTLIAMEGVIDVADRKTDEFDALRACIIELTLMLYTAPPQRKPLTDKAITQVIDSMPKKMKGFGVDWDLYEFARAIEAAHDIKENQ